MSRFLIVADESVDFGIVRLLREADFDVHAIVESSPGIPDREVLAIAVEKSSLLLTEDKDVGELVYRFNMEHRGILLLRLTHVDPVGNANLVVSVLQKYGAELVDLFAVLDEQQLRFRK